MAGFSPLMRSVILTPINTPVRLSTLLTALDANFPTRLGYLNLELDLTAAGNVYVGNVAVSPTNCGRHLVPAQGQNVMPFDTGLILTTDIYLYTDNNNNQLNVIALPIGM